MDNKPSVLCPTQDAILYFQLSSQVNTQNGSDLQMPRILPGSWVVVYKLWSVPVALVYSAISLGLILSTENIFHLNSFKSQFHPSRKLRILSELWDSKLSPLWYSNTLLINKSSLRSSPIIIFHCPKSQRLKCNNQNQTKPPSYQHSGVSARSTTLPTLSLHFFEGLAFWQHWLSLSCA